MAETAYNTYNSMIMRSLDVVNYGLKESHGHVYRPPIGLAICGSGERLVRPDVLVIMHLHIEYELFIRLQSAPLSPRAYSYM